jgi:hypothetical protein
MALKVTIASKELAISGKAVADAFITLKFLILYSPKFLIS